MVPVYNLPLSLPICELTRGGAGDTGHFLTNAKTDTWHTELAYFVQGVQRGVPFRFLQGQQVFLKHRVVQVKPDQCILISLCHWPAAQSQRHPLHRSPDCGWTIPVHAGCRPLPGVRVASARCLG